MWCAAMTKPVLFYTFKRGTIASVVAGLDPEVPPNPADLLRDAVRKGPTSAGGLRVMEIDKTPPHVMGNAE